MKYDLIGIILLELEMKEVSGEILLLFFVYNIEEEVEVNQNWKVWFVQKIIKVCYNNKY